MDHRIRAKADLTLLFVAGIWGLSFVAQRQSAQAIPALLFNAARWLLGGFLILPFIRFRLDLKRDSLFWMLAGGGLLFVASFLQQAGLKYTTAGNAGFVTGTYVVLIPLLLALIWKQRIHWTGWLAAMATGVGLFLLSHAGLAKLNFGDALELAGAFMWAFHVILTGLAVKKLSIGQFAAGQYLVCGLLNLILGMVFHPKEVSLLYPQWMNILYLGIAATAIGFSLQALGQRHAPPVDAAVILSMETVFAAFFGWLLLGEDLTAVQLAGCGIILLAILMPQVFRRPGELISPNTSGAN